jgi:hypothetical protein
MTLILVALGAFIVGVGVTVAVARYFFLLGWEKGRDDRALDPGDEVGQLPSAVPAETASEKTGPIETVVDEPAGRSSGRHSLERLWPDGAPTERVPAVEVRA